MPSVHSLLSIKKYNIIYIESLKRGHAQHVCNEFNGLLSCAWSYFFTNFRGLELPLKIIRKRRAHIGFG